MCLSLSIYLSTYLSLCIYLCRSLSLSFSISLSVSLSISLCLCLAGLARPYFERMYKPQRLTSFDSLMGPESFAAPLDAGDLSTLIIGTTDTKEEDEGHHSMDQSTPYPISSRVGRGLQQISTVSPCVPRPPKSRSAEEQNEENDNTGDDIVRSSSPLSVRGATAVDQLAAVAVYGVNRGVPGFFPPSTLTSVSPFHSSSPSPPPPSSAAINPSFSFNDSPSIPPNSVLMPPISQSRSQNSNSSSNSSSNSNSNSSSIINYSAPKYHDHEDNLLEGSDLIASQSLECLPPKMSYNGNSCYDVSTANNTDLAAGNNSGTGTGTGSSTDNSVSAHSSNQTSNQNSSGGFQLSKYVIDIGLRARSLVGGLLKREEGTVQVSAMPE